MLLSSVKADKILTQIRKQYLPTRANHMSLRKQIHTTRLCNALSLLKYSSYCSWEMYSSVGNWTNNVLHGSIFLNWQIPPALWAAPLFFNYSITVPDGFVGQWLWSLRVCCVKQIEMFSTKFWSKLSFVCHIVILLN